MVTRALTITNNIYEPTGRIAEYNVGVFKLTRSGLVVDGAPTFDEWAEFGEWLQFIQTSVQFAIGDWINYGESRWGEKYAQAVEETPYSEGTLRNFASIAGKFELSRRRDNLPFSHYCEVSSLPESTADALLEQAEDEQWSVTALRREARKAAHENGRKTVIPKGFYNVIYADPPWQYQNDWVNGAAEDHYPTMHIDDIKAFLGDSGIRIAENAVLFMWVTNPFIVKALDVIEAWGFQYKSNIVWVKTDLIKPGAGFYVRGHHELLFICTRGNFTPTDKNIAPPIGSVIKAPVQDHSRKPLMVYSIIERLYPDCNYVELFARDKRKGWDCHGNEL